MSTQLTSSRTHTIDTVLSGTMAYSPPELFGREPIYSYANDIWALGCIAYTLCCLKRPFDSDSAQSLIQKIVSSDPDPINTVAKEYCVSLFTTILLSYSSIYLSLFLTQLFNILLLYVTLSIEC